MMSEDEKDPYTESVADSSGYKLIISQFEWTIKASSTSPSLYCLLKVIYCYAAAYHHTIIRVIRQKIPDISQTFPWQKLIFPGHFSSWFLFFFCITSHLCQRWAKCLCCFPFFPMLMVWYYTASAGITSHLDIFYYTKLLNKLNINFKNRSFTRLFWLFLSKSDWWIPSYSKNGSPPPLFGQILTSPGEVNFVSINKTYDAIEGGRKGGQFKVSRLTSTYLIQGGRGLSCSPPKNNTTPLNLALYTGPEYFGANFGENSEQIFLKFGVHFLQIRSSFSVREIDNYNMRGNSYLRFHVISRRFHWTCAPIFILQSNVMDTIDHFTPIYLNMGTLSSV